MLFIKLIEIASVFYKLRTFSDYAKVGLDLFWPGINLVVASQVVFKYYLA